MTACVVCQERDPDDQSQACARCAGRLAGALRQVPVLVDELRGLGYVERDTRVEVCSTVSCAKRRVPADVVATVQWSPNFREPGLRLCWACLGPLAGQIVGDPVPAGRPADPVAHALTAGPLAGASTGPRAAGTRERSLPIRVDPTDLLAQARPASLSVAVTGLYAADQIGHLAVATELEFWARDWADERRERCPYPTVRILASWLLDRLDWACARHHALDEFAEKLRSMRSALTAAAGRSEPRPEVLEAPCPSCGQLALYRDADLQRIACGACPVLLTEDGYAEHVRELVDETQRPPG